jgi:hypothetical protein
MPRRPARPTLDCKASAATSAGGGELDTARGEHALGLEVAGESSGRVWPWRARLGCGSRLRRWLPAGRPAARPHPGRGRLPGRSRLPGPHQRPAPASRHAARTAPQPPGPRHAAATWFPAWIVSTGTARRGRREPSVGQAGRPHGVLPGRSAAAAAGTRAARRPRPGQRSSPTAGGRPHPPDGGGDHDVERSAGPPQWRSDGPARSPPRRVPQLRPDGGRAAGRRRRPAAASAAGPGSPGWAGKQGRTGTRLPATRAAVADRRPVSRRGGRTDAARSRPVRRRLRSVRIRSVRIRTVHARTVRVRPVRV